MLNEQLKIEIEKLKEENKRLAKEVENWKLKHEESRPSPGYIHFEYPDMSGCIGY